MGRSPASSCLRIIACAGGDDAADPTANALENKSSGDKRGWSFRKKSGKQRGFISNVVTETTPAYRTRETLESALLKSPSPDNNNVSEKQSFSVQSVDEKSSQLPATYVAEPVDEKKTLSDKTELSVSQIDNRTELVEPKGTDTEEDDLIETESQVKEEGPNAADASMLEKDITSEVKLPSKLEPEESEIDDVITTRKESNEDVDEKLDDSVIVMIQAAIRGFLARRELSRRKKVVKLQAAVRGHLVRSQAMGSLRCVQAIVKMQTLVRARHSMKDGSHVSAISDKAETNVSAQKLLENKFAKHLMESTPKTKPISMKCDPTKPSSAWNWLERWMSVTKPDKTSNAYLATEEQQLKETDNVKVSSQFDLMNSDATLETKTETGFSSYEASKLEVQCVDLSETEKMSQYDSSEASVEVDHDLIQSHSLADKDPDSLLEEPGYVNVQAKNSLKRKASNPSFIAAHSKFEELTSSTGSNKAMTLSSKNGVLGEEGKTDVDSSEADNTNTRKDHSEDVAPAELGGSECGTELSVTSSLDSLDKKSDFEGAEPKVEAKILENSTIKTHQEELIEIDVKDETPLGTVEDPKEKVENVKSEVKISATQHESAIRTPDSKKRQAEEESGVQAYPLSEEALTPMTITESQATPASQASSSVKARKGKSEKSSSSQKRKVNKKIASSPKQDSGTSEANNTTEQQEEKEQRSGRRKSFGIDQEARESSGGKNSIPRFMQPTQSAKAKVQEHNSPRSSPDLQERDVSIKKRHSLPVVANGKQSSPRIQRFTSQAQPGTKDKKWQR